MLRLFNALIDPLSLTRLGVSWLATHSKLTKQA